MKEYKELELELKKLVIEALALEDVEIADIESEQELFSIGLGLDSIDILELIMALRREYEIEFSEDPDEVKEQFASIRALANYITTELAKV